MARSKDVYAVLGMMCVSQSFRNDFFEDPLPAARSLVGALTEDDIAQLNGVAGNAELNRDTYVASLKQAFNGVYSAMRCPSFPCPNDDPFA
ncbi:MAG: hypothetical protein ABIQ52_10615 [Vicinamibacterales bacterium]